jgi:putative hydrolase of the HAD superfamily
LNATPAGDLRAVLLDALGTLLELQPPAPFLRSELADRFGVLLGEVEAQQAIAAEIAFYRTHLDEGRDERSLANLRERCAQALREAMPEEVRARLPPAPGLLEPLLAALRFRLYPEVRAALDGFRRRGLSLVVVSNWDVSLHALLKNVGLSPKLAGIVTSAEAGARKPSPAIFSQALRVAGVSAAQAIHVGDSIDEDVAGARACGITPLLLRRGGEPPIEGVRTIHGLDQALE